jgi:putative FmdB family regulatory protein
VPTYQYACTECGHALEAQQSFTDDPLSTCPECSGRLRKVFSAVGVVFKGSGFYRNDSRSDTAAASAKADDAGPKKSDASDSGSTGKPADKGAGSTSGTGGEKKTPSATSGASSSGSSSGSAA